MKPPRYFFKLDVLLLILFSFISLSGTNSILLPNPVLDYTKTSYFSDNNPYKYGPLLDIKFKISEKDYNKSVSFVNFVISSLVTLESNLGLSDIKIKYGTPSHSQFLMSRPDLEAVQQGKQALINTKVTSHLLNTYCHKLKLKGVNCAEVISTELDLCSSATKCNSDGRFRSIDGFCNNLNDGSIGKSYTSYKRLIFSDYLDGVYVPKRSASKKQLPSPRSISATLVGHDNVEYNKLTLAVMQWTQFISHDLSYTASSKMIHSGDTIECCSSTGSKLSPRYLHPFCVPITIPPDDKFYAKHGIQCMSYVRSLLANRPDCKLGPAEQLNQASHFLDGSQLYGSNKHIATSLRTLSNGLLKTSKKAEKRYLSTSENDCESKDGICFKSGDLRVNVQPHLTVFHTIWTREHNRIATKLSELNPSWDDERLYEEARAIVIAEIQHITYSDWLPNILGQNYMDKINSFTSYNSGIDASVSNSFATAAIRFLKSLMSGDLKLYLENRNISGSIKLRDYYYNPSIILKQNVLDELLRGLATQNSQKADFHYVEDISNYLFGNGKAGLDIMSLDIQRGRDHGLPGYASFRRLCGLQSIQHFHDLSDSISEEGVSLLSKIYKDPQDIDLIVGGMLEKNVKDSLLGPTFSCIIADQFLRTRSGDRYFYKFNRYSPSQLEEIDKVTLARIFCDNGDDIRFMQSNVFHVLSISNKLQACKSSIIPTLNLDAWKEH